MVKLVIVDLDGTLVDTKDVNYYAYKEALKFYGFEIEYKYYCNFCNGRHYLEFLPQLTTHDRNILNKIHDSKKKIYKKYLNKARLNTSLVNIVKLLSKECKTAVVTTASKENCYELLEHFGLNDFFDLIITREDVHASKPNPEGFLKAMKYFDVYPEETVIFEDSEVGLEAAKISGAYYYKTFKFN